MKRSMLLATIGLVLLLAACGGAAEQAAPAGPAPQGAPAQEVSFDAEAPVDQQEQDGQQAVERLIIKDATLSLEVQDVRAAEAAISTQAEELGGYVVSVETSGTDDRMRSTIVFRVPAQRFEQALEQVQSLADELLSRTISGDDVTEEFVDLEARLRNLEATRDRLLELLDRANDVEDALSVNTSLSQVQGEIEQVRGRMQYLQQSAALSTITVSLYGEPPAPPLVAENSWQPLAVASEALRALLTLAEALLYVVIVLLIWTPVWLPFVLLGRWLWKRNRKRQQAIPTSPTTPTSHPH